MAVYVDKELCKSCGICISVCRRDVFVIGNQVNRKGYNYAVAERAEQCVNCMQCQNRCPDFAIYIKK